MNCKPKLWNYHPQFGFHRIPPLSEEQRKSSFSEAKIQSLNAESEIQSLDSQTPGERIFEAKSWSLNSCNFTRKLLKTFFGRRILLVRPAWVWNGPESGARQQIFIRTSRRPGWKHSMNAGDCALGAGMCGRGWRWSDEASVWNCANSGIRCWH